MEVPRPSFPGRAQLGHIGNQRTPRQFCAPDFGGFTSFFSRKNCDDAVLHGDNREDVGDHRTK
jgi:hypothetical protein